MSHKVAEKQISEQDNEPQTHHSHPHISEHFFLNSQALIPHLCCSLFMWILERFLKLLFQGFSGSPYYANNIVLSKKNTPRPLGMEASLLSANIDFTFSDIFSSAPLCCSPRPQSLLIPECVLHCSYYSHCLKGPAQCHFLKMPFLQRPAFTVEHAFMLPRRI